MFAGSAPVHRQDVSRLLLALPHQEVAVLPQQLLNLQSGNNSVVPGLLFQRKLHVLPHGATREGLMRRSAKRKSPMLKMCSQKKKLKETTVSGVKDDSVEDI